MNWKRLTTNTVYDNDWITVFDEQVVNPRGGTNKYGRVHFKNKAVAILPIDKERNTWIVGQDRYTLGEYSWELPMGGAPQDEEPLTAAKRELKEETGLSAQRWTPLLQLHVSNSITDEEAIIFVAEDLQCGQPAFDDTEDLKIRRLPLAEAIEMARQGEITDAVSVAALLCVQGDKF